MILVDMNQVTISNLMIQMKDEPLSEDLVRHMVLNSLRSYKTKFSKDFGELVLCYDDKHCWRKDYFPYYKQNRKKARSESSLDWNELFDILTKIQNELEENFPYKVLKINGAEADDIIAILSNKISSTPNLYEEILIISGDKDFIQLHQSDNVKQYSPTLKKFVVDENPEQYKFEHIIRGDKGDGVPNVLSQDTVFVEDLRQRPITKKKLIEWKENGIPEGEIKRNYQRNKTLIDFDSIPNELGELIYNMWVDKITQNDKSKILPYFMKHRLKELTEKLGDF
jgi:5'-3' exonuclease